MEHSTWTHTLSKRTLSMLLALCLLLFAIPITEFPFIVSQAAAKNVNITEQQLFQLYPAYLSPYAERIVLSNSKDRYCEMLEKHSSEGDSFMASYMYSLKEGTKLWGRELLAGFGLTESTKETMSIKSAQAIIKNITGQKLAIEKSVKDVTKDYKHLKSLYDLTTNNGKAAFYKDLAKANPHLPTEEVEKLANNLFSKGDKYFKFISKGLDAVTFAIGLFELISLEQSVIRNLISLIPEGYNLRADLTLLLNNINKDAWKHVVDHYTQDKVAGLITDIIMSGMSGGEIGSLAAALGQTLIYIAVTYLYQGAFADDIIQTTCLSNYVTELQILITDHRTKFMQSYSDKTAISSEEIENYRLLYTDYIAGIKTTLESAKKLTKNKAEISIIDQTISTLDSYSYEAYLTFCINEVKEDIKKGVIEAPKDAATTSVKTGDNTGEDYTNDANFAAKLDSVINGTAKLFSNTDATYPVGSSLDVNFQYTWAGYSGYQCYAYAQAVYYYLFGDVVYHGSGPYANSSVVIQNVTSLNYDSLSKAGVGCGAYIRTTPNSDGSYNGNSGHSIIILSYDKNGITILQSDSGENGLIKLESRSWSDFNTYLVNDSGKRVSHVVQPNGTKGTSMPLLEHDWGEGQLVCYATSKEDGFKEYYCPHCGEEKIEIVPMASDITLSSGSFIYNGKVQRPSVSVKTRTGTTLTEGRDYDVFYSSGCKEPGSYTVTIEFHGDYGEKATKTFIITEEEHDWGEGQLVCYATSKEDGYKEYYCSLCGEEKTEIVPMASDISLSSDSFIYNGKVQHPSVIVKTRIGSTLTEGKDYDVSYSSGCKEPGSYTVTIKFYGDYGEKATMTFAITPHEPHIWDSGKVTHYATETTEGEKVFTCTVCGKTKTEPIPIPVIHVHTWNSGKVTKDPTCTELGVRMFTCTVCKETMTKDIPANGHTKVAGVLVTPTCTRNGRTAGIICTVCGEVLKESAVIPATGHAYGKWTKLNDEEHQRVCANDASHVETEPHIWDEGKVTKEATAEVEGEATFTCSVCGATRAEPIEKPAPEELTDPQSDITLSFATGAFSTGVTLRVQEVKDGEKLLDEPYSAVTAFDIATFVGDKQVQPKSSVTVKIPIPMGYKVEAIEVYHIADNGAKEKVSIRIENGFIIFKAESFSIYAVVDTSSKADFVPGDVDGNGKIESADARLSLRASVKLEHYESGSAPFLAADADGNGVIESSDARLILRASVKLEALPQKP